MSPEEKRGCETELENLMRLNSHPFIIKVKELYQDKDEFDYLVTEYMPDGDLWGIIKLRK